MFTTLSRLYSRCDVPSPPQTVRPKIPFVLLGDRVSPLPRRRPCQAGRLACSSALRACKRAWDSWDSQATRGSSLRPVGTWSPRPATQATAGRFWRRRASDRPTPAGTGVGLRGSGLPCAPRPRRPAHPCLLRRRAFLGRHLFATRSLLSRLAPERVNLPGLGSQLLSNLHRPSWAAPPRRRNPPSRPPGPRIHDTRACNLFKGVVESTFRKQPAHRRR